MKKGMKKVLAIVLAFSLSWCTIIEVAAKEDVSNGEAGIDIYEENYSETIELEGTNYTYQYYYDDDGNRAVNVINESNGNIDIVKFDDDLQYIILNGKVCGKVCETVSQEDKEIPLQRRDGKEASDAWIFFSQGSQKITFAQGVSVAVLAVIIATAIGNLGGAAVIAAMGYNALAVVAASSIGGTVSTTVYKFNSNLITQWRYDWSFRASNGDYYGVYTSLSPIT